MKIGDLGEKSFIREILGTAAVTAKPDDFDDCVVLDLPALTGVEEMPFLVYSLDHPSFVRHPAADVPPYRYYGRWVAAVTSNDVVAMGARCRGFSLDLSAPPETEVENVRELIAGISDVLEHYGAVYEGGNFDASPLETVGFAWGLVSQEALVRRTGARPGDLVAVTGVLGKGWVEYQVRKAGRYDDLPPEIAEEFRAYKRLPVGAAEPIARAADEGLLTSGMDLSDGLVEFLHTIADRNGLGVVVESADLPVTPSTRAAVPLLEELGDFPGALRAHPELVALEPGYDSPLVHAFTVKARDWAKAERIFRGAGAELHRIGTVVEESGPWLSLEGRRCAIPAFWDDQCRTGDKLADWFAFLSTLVESMS